MSTTIYSKEQIDAIASVIGSRSKTLVNSEASASAILAKIAATPDVNVITDAERTAIGQIEPSHYKGSYATIGDIPTVGAVAGDYATLIVEGGDDTHAIYDADDDVWVDTKSAVTGETAASIKTKYESNPNTNAFTDAQKTKLDALTVAENTSDFTAALDAAIA